ncbi:MAG: hypothetical protein LQ339_001026 [Xanthoria mediterranea]|nr:MAG: hypothetical protein LQ339_001026 [Xanthoria mediterranea]
MSATISATGGPIYFFREHEHPYGFLSQLFDAPFTAAASSSPDPDPDDATPLTFRTAEQYMMYRKALLFGDAEVAERIMLAITPKEHKALGRKVKNFDGTVWDARREGIRRGRELEEILQLEKRCKASPFDRIWGIGYSAEHAEANRSKWGANLLGKALVRVRERIKAQNNVAG